MADNSFRSFSTITPTPVIRPATMQPSPHYRIQNVSDIPSYGYQTELLNWISQALKEGESMIATEAQGEDIEENIKMVMGQFDRLSSEINKPSYRSKHTSPRLGKNVNDIASAITDFRPTWHYKTYNTMYEHQGQILDKLSVAWFYNQYIDLKLQLLVKQSLIGRTGYAYLCFNPTLSNNLGDIDLIVKDYRDIIPIRPNSKITIQDSFGVIIKSRNTVNWARIRYPDKASLITPTSEGSLLKQNTSSNMRVSSPALDYLDAQRSKGSNDFAIPLYDHYEIYIKDPSTNQSGKKVWVGPGPEGQHPWGYYVEPTKPLYPRGRLIVVANLITVLFDGGNPYWHGMFPVAKLTLDPMPFNFLGKSAIADAKWSQLAVNELLQGVMDASRKALRPGIIADKNAVPREILAKFDTQEPGFKLKTNPSVGQGVILEQPQPLPDYVMNLRQLLIQEMDYNMGVTDMRMLEQVRQMSGTVDTEAMLEYLGPSIRSRGRVLEVFMREIGEMMKSNFFQFYNMGRRVQILGKDGMDFDDFDYDPGSLVPAFSVESLPPQDVNKFYNSSTGEDGRPQYDLKPRSERAAEHTKSFVFFLTPNSLLNMSKQRDQLLYLQLFRAGVLDPVTLLEKLDIPNIGELPGNPLTIIERMQAAQSVGAVGAVSAAGRKASGQEMPQMRNDGSISESG